MQYSIELVPRSWESLKEESSQNVDSFPEIKTLNVPDLLNFDIRSWEACDELKTKFSNVIPHIRAIDFNLKESFPLTQFLNNSGIKSVLVIAGDPPQDLSKRTYRNSSCELIRILKKEIPDIHVYAGIDQYRNSLRNELDYIQDKLEAGADGFFTQPFFDLGLLDIFMDLLEGTEVYWGISPVYSEKSKAYWENKNAAVFPTHFEPTDQWNIEFGKAMLERVGEKNGNIYFMPIRVNISEYLGSILL